MLRAGCLTLTRAEASRRDFLKAGSLGFLGIHLSQFLAAQNTVAAAGANAKPKAQACILVWLEGGPSHNGTWGPKANRNFKTIFNKVDGHPSLGVRAQIPRPHDKQFV